VVDFHEGCRFANRWLLYGELQGLHVSWNFVELIEEFFFWWTSGNLN
jgi:hypothetical protein